MFKLLLLLSVFASKSIAENPCPQHWTDATHVNLGCLLFNVTNPGSWLEGQDSCAKNHNSHLVEIYNQEHQDYLEMKAYEIELFSGGGRYWWIGLSDEGSEGRWFWMHSLQEANYTSWTQGYPRNVTEFNFAAMICLEDFNYHWTDVPNHEPNFPICQFFP